LQRAVVVAAALLQLVIRRAQEKLVVPVVALPEIAQVVQVRPLDQGLRVKVLAVAYRPY
jgi:hypothetical protein